MGAVQSNHRPGVRVHERHRRATTSTDRCLDVAEGPEQTRQLPVAEVFRLAQEPLQELSRTAHTRYRGGSSADLQLRVSCQTAELKWDRFGREA